MRSSGKQNKFSKVNAISISQEKTMETLLFLSFETQNSKLYSMDESMVCDVVLEKKGEWCYVVSDGGWCYGKYLFIV